MNTAALVALVAVASVVSVAGLAVAAGPASHTLSTMSDKNGGHGMMDSGMMRQGGPGTCPMYNEWAHDWNYSYDPNYGGCPCMN